MIAPGPAPGDLRSNPDWASLPLFDRKGWRWIRFGKFAENISERVEPADVEEEIYVGPGHLDPENMHTRRWRKGSDVVGTKLRFRKGDIIFGRRRAYQRWLLQVGDTGHSWEDFRQFLWDKAPFNRRSV